MDRDNAYLPLFETKAAKGRVLYWSYAISMLIAIAFICAYRVAHFPLQNDLKTWAWLAMFMAELWYIFYWVITQSLRYRPMYRSTFKERLSNRYEEILPGIDIFVCTADPELEPPLMVINTVLSLMAYDYPTAKLNVYLSDDGGSELMFYALLEASEFSKFWLPFCRKFKIDPRAPNVYFSTDANTPDDDLNKDQERKKVKGLYEDMKERINEATKLGAVPGELKKHHKGFREWEMGASRRDHQTILQVLIDGIGGREVDAEGKLLPTLVYLAREKRPEYHHNFKAGSMNALIRVSSRISNSPIILNVDCDMYSNNSESIRDILCFFMDEQQSDRIAFVQYPQFFSNVTKNDIYGNYIRVTYELEFQGLDGNGGPLYIGTGCFHRREALCGKTYEFKNNWRVDNVSNDKPVKKSANLLEEECKILAGCRYEEGSPWGKEMGLKYGCAVEDVITGLTIQCRGWKSITFNPKKKGFAGLAPTTLIDTLVQHSRWAEGNLQIFLSKYSTFLYGHGKIPLTLQMSYNCYNLWGINCLATLCYVIIPPFCLLKGISLFPQLSSFWILPHAYIFITRNAYSLEEFLRCGGTVKGWYNEQRIWLYKRLTSYLYALYRIIMSFLGISKFTFNITSKVADEDASERYEKEIMEFGTTSSMFTILSTIATFNLFTLIWIAKNIIMTTETTNFVDSYALQIILNGLVVLINFPLFQGLFLRKDSGRIPSIIMYQSLVISSIAYMFAVY